MLIRFAKNWSEYCGETAMKGAGGPHGDRQSVQIDKDSTPVTAVINDHRSMNYDVLTVGIHFKK